MGVCALAVACSDGSSSEGELSTAQSQAIWSAAQSALTAVQNPLVGGVDTKNRSATSRRASSTGDGGLGDRAGDGGLRDRAGDGGAAAIHVTGTISSFQVSGTVENPSAAGSASVSGSGGKKASKRTR